MLLNIILSFNFLFAQANSVEVLEVRGTKERKSFLELIESVSVLGEEELPGAGRENDLEILNGVANVQVNNNNESFSIRGINSTGVTGFQKDNLASLLIDGLFQTDLALQAGSFNLWDMDRIEVLRGAQSTTQGINSLAGSINLYHQDPTFSHQGAARVTLGNFDHTEMGLMVNVPLSSQLATRVSVEGESNGGYITNEATGDERWGQRTRQRAETTTLYRINDSHDLRINAKYNKNRQGGTYTQGNDPFDYKVYEDEGFINETENHQFSGLFSSLLSEHLSNEFFVGYSKSRQHHFSDADGQPTNIAGRRDEFRNDHFFTVENRFYIEKDSFTNMLGFHIHDFQLQEAYNFNLLFPLPGNLSTPVNVGQDVNRTRKVYSVFDSFTYRFNDNHSLVLGLRGEIAESIYGTEVNGQRLQNLGAPTNAAVDAYIAQVAGEYQGFQNNFVFLPKIGYSLGFDEHRWGLSYTRGYRTSGVSINRLRATAVEYDPEFTDNYELSYKYSKQNLQVAANFFYIQWTDQQVQVQLSNNFYDTQVENAASSHLFGGELEGCYQLTSKQKLNLGIGYTQTQFEDFQTLSQNYTGKEFPYAPQWTSRLSHIYDISQNLSFLTVVRYLQKSFNNAENTREGDSQFYVNLNGVYRLGPWTFQAYVNNLLDGQFLIYDGRPTSSTSPYQTNYFQTNAPRESGLRVRYDW